MNKLFKIFNTDRTKNRKITIFAPLELEINGYVKRIDIEVMELNGTDMFLGYNWLAEHNLEVNWNIGTIWFTKCLTECRIQHQNILFTSRI